MTFSTDVMYGSRCFTGLANTIHVPAGSKAQIIQHIKEVECVLGLKRTKYVDNPIHYWSDELLCQTVEQHNRWVRGWYEKLAHWGAHPFRVGKGHKAKHVIDREYPIAHQSEKLTPKDAEEFWHGFEELKVEPSRWSADYYRDRMEHLYEVMRGQQHEGVSFNAKALNPKQAAGVILIFSEFLDTHDIRLEVPNGRDHLAASYDGGYTWCEKCGAVAEGEEGSCRKRKCPLREIGEYSRSLAEIGAQSFAKPSLH